MLPTLTHSVAIRHSLTTETMEFAINSASAEVYFVLRSSCKMNAKEKNAVFGGTEYSLVGYPLTRAISGHKMSAMVNVKVYTD